MAEIIDFPVIKKQIRYKFADVIEEAFAVTAINLWGNMYNMPLASPHNLHEFDGDFVLTCLNKAANSDVFSVRARRTYSKIYTDISKQLNRPTND